MFHIHIAQLAIQISNQQQKLGAQRELGMYIQLQAKYLTYSSGKHYTNHVEQDESVYHDT